MALPVRIARAAIPAALGRAEHVLDGRAFGGGGSRIEEVDVHQSPGIVAGSATSALACRSGVVSLSTRTAQALNSAVPLLGSVTSIVSRLVSTWSGKWNVMHVSPGRSDGSMWTGVSNEQSRQDTR